MTAPTQDRDAVAVILREHGLSDRPDLYDSSIHGWRCEYPDRYGRCDCFAQLRDSLVAWHLAAQVPTDAEVEAGIQAETDSLAAEIHEAVEFQYDQCDHGTYHGGHMHGEPYQMCRINAERIVRRRAARRDEEKR